MQFFTTKAAKSWDTITDQKLSLNYDQKLLKKYFFTVGLKISKKEDRSSDGRSEEEAHI